MAVLSFTSCVIDVTIIILCLPFPSLPPSSLSTKQQEPDRRDRKAVRLTSHLTCRISLMYKPSGCELSNMWRCSWFQHRARACATSVRLREAAAHPRLLLLMTPRFHDLPPLLPPAPVTLLSCSLHARPCVPAVALYYWLFKAPHCKITNVFFIFYGFLFLCIIYVKIS